MVERQSYWNLACNDLHPMPNECVEETTIFIRLDSSLSKTNYMEMSIT